MKEMLHGDRRDLSADLALVAADIEANSGNIPGVSDTLRVFDRRVGSGGDDTVLQDAHALATLLRGQGFIVQEAPMGIQSGVMLRQHEAVEARETLRLLTENGGSAEDIAFVQAALDSLSAPQ